jgi:SUMO ligase MMS21 Smc5/6 complex component
VHQLLRDSQKLLELAISRHGAGRYRSHHDWSAKDLKDMLHFLLETRSRPLCVFVDGLDEVANADGLDILTKLIEEMIEFPEIKVCVSSRPEAWVIHLLKERNGPCLRRAY